METPFFKHLYKRKWSQRILKYCLVLLLCYVVIYYSYIGSGLLSMSNLMFSNGSSRSILSERVHGFGTVGVYVRALGNYNGRRSRKAQEEKESLRRQRDDDEAYFDVDIDMTSFNDGVYTAGESDAQDVDIGLSSSEISDYYNWHYNNNNNMNNNNNNRNNNNTNNNNNDLLSNATGVHGNNTSFLALDEDDEYIAFLLRNKPCFRKFWISVKATQKAYNVRFRRVRNIRSKSNRARGGFWDLNSSRSNVNDGSFRNWDHSIPASERRHPNLDFKPLNSNWDRRKNPKWHHSTPTSERRHPNLDFKHLNSNWDRRTNPKLWDYSSARSDGVTGVSDKSNPNSNDVREVLHCDRCVTMPDRLGRTGNHMFQLAVTLATAYRHDAIPLIRNKDPLRRWFPLPLDIGACANLTNRHIFYTNASNLYFPEIEKLSPAYNWSLIGYFQSWKYFQKPTNVFVRKLFTLKAEFITNAERFLGLPISSKSRSMLKSRKRSNDTPISTVNVCMHIRRGDFTMTSSIQKGFVPANMTFINKSMDYFRNRHKEVKFVVLSDGMEWCKEKLRHHDDVIFSPFHLAGDDMALMMLCDHVIVTSGTFGWWGGWFSRGRTVYFSGFPKKGSWLDKQFRHEDYYPPTWIPL